MFVSKLHQNLYGLQILTRFWLNEKKQKLIYEPIKVDKLVSQISAVSDNIEDISEEVQNMTDVIGEVEDTIKDCFYFWLNLRLSKFGFL